MKKFINNIFIFTVPIVSIGLIVSCPFLYLSIISKEILPVTMGLKEQINNHELLIGYALDYADPILKYKLTENYKPDILILGTSRVMQIHKSFFNSNYSFYNAGGAVSNIEGYISFVEKLSYTPKLLIIGLDQNFFNEKWRAYNNVIPNYAYNYSAIRILQNCMKLYFFENLSMNISNPNRYIGLNAVVHNEGFKHDGTYYYGRIIEHPESVYSKKYLKPFSDIKERILSGNARFEYGSLVDISAVEMLFKFLKICNEKNIKVIGIIPPYAPEIYKIMIRSGNYKYINSIKLKLEPVFSEFGYELFDYSDVSNFSDDSMFIDGFHGSDVVYLNLLKSMKTKESIISNYLKSEMLLNKFVETRRSSLSLY